MGEGIINFNLSQKQGGLLGSLNMPVSNNLQNKLVFLPWPDVE